MCSQNGLGFLKFSIFEHVAFSLGSVIKIHLCKSVQVRAHRNKCGLSGAGAKWSARPAARRGGGRAVGWAGAPGTPCPPRDTPAGSPHAVCTTLGAHSLVPPGRRGPPHSADAVARTLLPSAPRTALRAPDFRLHPQHLLRDATQRRPQCARQLMQAMSTDPRLFLEDSAILLFYQIRNVLFSQISLLFYIFILGLLCFDIKFF